MNTESARIAVAFHSGYGHTAKQAPPETDLRTAHALGARGATVTLRHLRGSLAA